MEVIKHHLDFFFPPHKNNNKNNNREPLRKKGRNSFISHTDNDILRDMIILKERPSRLLHSFFFPSLDFFSIQFSMPYWWSPLRMWGRDLLCNNSIPCVVGKKWRGHKMEVWHWRDVYKRKARSLSCTWTPVIASCKSTEKSTHSKPVHVAFCGFNALVEVLMMDLSLHTVLLISATFCVFVQEGKSWPISSCYAVVKDANLYEVHWRGVHYILSQNINIRNIFFQ